MAKIFRRPPNIITKSMGQNSPRLKLQPGNKCSDEDLDLMADGPQRHVLETVKGHTVQVLLS